MFVECLHLHFRLVGVAEDSSCFRRLYSCELAPEETFQIQVQEKAAMVGENNLVKGIDAALLNEGKDFGRDEDVVQSLGAAAIGAKFAISAVGVGIWIGKIALSDEVC